MLSIILVQALILMVCSIQREAKVILQPFAGTSQKSTLTISGMLLIGKSKYKTIAMVSPTILIIVLTISRVIASTVFHTVMYGPSYRTVQFVFSLLSQVTQQRYRESLEWFDEEVEKLGLAFAAADEESQDYIIADLIVQAYDDDEGFSRQFYVNLVAGLQKRTLNRRRYRAASTVLAGIQSLHPPEQVEPMEEMLCYAWFVLICGWKQARIAVAGLLSFVGLLRIGETLSLQWQDILLPHQHRNGTFVCLILRKTKLKPADSVTIFLDNPVVVAILCEYCKVFGGQPGDRVFPFSYTTFARWLQKGLEELKVAGNYRSHSFRRGGATALSLSGAPFSKVMEAGRWVSEQSCKLYIKKGEVLLMRYRKRLSSAVLQRIEKLANSISDISFRSD